MNGLDLVPEQQNLIVISAHTIHQAERRIFSCENCSPADAEIPFDWILDEVTGSDSTTTDYFMEKPAICPHCYHDVFENGFAR